jgi:hypothetical protein
VCDRGESAGTSWEPETVRREEEENEITQPMRVICSREPHATVPRKPRQRLYEEKEAEGEIQRTPDWNEIGDPTA